MKDTEIEERIEGSRTLLIFLLALIGLTEGFTLHLFPATDQRLTSFVLGQQ